MSAVRNVDDVHGARLPQRDRVPGIAHVFTDGDIKLGSCLRHAVNIVKRRDTLDILRFVVFPQPLNQPHGVSRVNVVAKIKRLHCDAVAHLVLERGEEHLIEVRRAANVRPEIIETFAKQSLDQR